MKKLTSIDNFYKCIGKILRKILFYFALSALLIVALAFGYTQTYRSPYVFWCIIVSMLIVFIASWWIFDECFLSNESGSKSTKEYKTRFLSNIFFTLSLLLWAIPFVIEKTTNLFFLESENIKFDDIFNISFSLLIAMITITSICFTFFIQKNQHKQQRSCKMILSTSRNKIWFVDSVLFLLVDCSLILVSHFLHCAVSMWLAFFLVIVHAYTTYHYYLLSIFNYLNKKSK